MSVFKESREECPPRPRQLVLRLLGWIAGERDRESLLGDLLEEHGALEATRGKAAADRWLLGQALGSVLPVLRRRVAKAVSRAVLTGDAMQYHAVTEGADMFERSLLSFSERQAPQRKWWSVPTAIGVHLFLVSGVMIARVWSIEELPAPVIQENYIGVYLPPPPAPEAGAKAPARPRVPGVVKQTPRRLPRLQQPVFTPESIPEPVLQAAGPDLEEFSLPEAAFAGDGDTGGDPAGQPGGVDGGVPGGTGDLPMVVAGAVQKPELLQKVQPRYTECARRAKIQGTVIVEAIIDRQGNVTGARVLQGLGCGLSEEALRAVEQWKFRPATLNHRPVTVYFTVTVKFTLN